MRSQRGPVHNFSSGLDDVAKVTVGFLNPEEASPLSLRGEPQATY